MIIKEAKYEDVMVKQRRCVSDAVYGCDECRNEIKDYPNEENRLEITVFKHNEEGAHLHFCSWECVLKKLPKIKTDYFVSLPLVSFETKSKNPKGAKSLMRLLRKLNKEV